MAEGIVTRMISKQESKATEMTMYAKTRDQK